MNTPRPNLEVMPENGADATAPAAIRIEGLQKTYERITGREVVRTRALTEVNMTVGADEFVALIGPSGCGKTTVLKTVAGLLEPTAGVITVGGRRVKGPGTDRGVVFQQAALLPWLTVKSNVTQALEFAGIPRRDRQQRAVRYLDLVGLAAFHDHYPAELSGGMQQRVGIARALGLEPDVLLMDEPFGALDAITRQHMQIELLRIWEHERKAVLFVTHSLDESLLLADRVVVMNKGGIADDVPVPLSRPRDRHTMKNDSDVAALRLHLESML